MLRSLTIGNSNSKNKIREVLQSYIFENIKQETMLDEFRISNFNSILKLYHSVLNESLDEEVSKKLLELLQTLEVPRGSQSQSSSIVMTNFLTAKWKIITLIITRYFVTSLSTFRVQISLKFPEMVPKLMKHCTQSLSRATTSILASIYLCINTIMYSKDSQNSEGNTFLKSNFNRRINGNASTTLGKFL